MTRDLKALTDELQGVHPFGIGFTDEGMPEFDAFDGADMILSQIRHHRVDPNCVNNLYGDVLKENSFYVVSLEGIRIFDINSGNLQPWNSGGYLLGGLRAYQLFRQTMIPLIDRLVGRVDKLLDYNERLRGQREERYTFGESERVAAEWEQKSLSQDIKIQRLELEIENRDTKIREVKENYKKLRSKIEPPYSSPIGPQLKKERKERRSIPIGLRVPIEEYFKMQVAVDGEVASDEVPDDIDFSYDIDSIEEGEKNFRFNTLGVGYNNSVRGSPL